MATIHRYQFTIMNICASGLKIIGKIPKVISESLWRNVRGRGVRRKVRDTHTNIKMAMTAMVNVSCIVRRQKTLRTKLLRMRTSLKSPMYSSASSCGSVCSLRCSRAHALYSSRFSRSLCATISSVTVMVYGPWVKIQKLDRTIDRQNG